jgi:hypothetical protein
LPLKNSLHLLPERPDCREQLFWLAQEVEAEGGEAVVLECAGLGNVPEAEARDLFRCARDEDYAALEREACELSARCAANAGEERSQREVRAFLRKAARRLSAIRGIDYFPSGRAEVLGLVLDALAARLDGQAAAAETPCRAGDYLGRTWVTRAQPYIDRLSSFWLVRRRIDAGAAIRFLGPDEVVPQGPEFASFDMPGADFTHRGGLVTFEALAQDFGLQDAAVRRLMGIVRAIDLAADLLEGSGEDGGLPAEARAVKDVLDGLIKISATDAELLERAMLLFDALAASYDTGA